MPAWPSPRWRGRSRTTTRRSARRCWSRWPAGSDRQGRRAGRGEGAQGQVRQDAAAGGPDAGGDQSTEEEVVAALASATADAEAGGTRSTPWVISAGGAGRAAGAVQGAGKPATRQHAAWRWARSGLSAGRAGAAASSTRTPTFASTRCWPGDGGGGGAAVPGEGADRGQGCQRAAERGHGIGGLWAKAKAAVPALIQALKERTPTSRCGGAGAGRIGPGAKEAVPALRGCSTIRTSCYATPPAAVKQIEEK